MKVALSPFSSTSPQRLFFLPAILLLLVSAELGGQLTEPLAPCSLEGVEEPARCGTFEVAEDPEDPESRRIGLRIATLPKRNDDSTSPPLAVLAGGPGQAATALAGFAANVFDTLRDERDILLIDVRGTGGSNALNCPELGDLYAAGGPMGALFDPGVIRRCRETLTEKADLTRYTTSVIADDLVAAWRTLGHRQVDVYGTSYGTRLALEILRRSPESLRTVVLKGVAPMELRMPLDYPRDGQRSLDRVFEHCRAEAECAAAYPHLETELIDVLEALEAGVEVELRHPASGETVDIRFHRDPVTQSMMAALQSTDAAVFLPRMIHEAASGHWEPLTSFALFYRVTLAAALQEGLFLSVTCAEDLPFIDDEVAARVAEDTFLGLARYRDQAAACEVWDVPAVSASFREPVAASVPTLLISGNYDPVTPPRWGRKASARLASSFHLVVPGGSHSFSGMVGCVEEIIARFVRSGELPESVDSCVDDVALGAFSLPGDPWPPMVQTAKVAEKDG